MRKNFFWVALTAIARLFLLMTMAHAKAAHEPYSPEYDTSGNITEAEDFLPKIVGYDLSVVLAKSSPGQVGFIGNDGQRFYIHFISADKTKDDPYTYIIVGRTRVKNNICDFDGRITIRKAGIYKKVPADDEFPDFRQGFIGADVELFEVNGQKGSGKIKGILHSYIAIDQKGKLVYDDLRDNPNNLFSGTWTSYKTRAAKVCNFGHWRFPHTGLPEGVWLDQGVTQFLPKDEYIEKGWQSYAGCYRSYQAAGDARSPDKAREEACREEEKQWWLN